MSSFRIRSNDPIAPSVFRMEVEAPDIAKYRRAGQFVIVHPSGGRERIPLTIADADPVAGTITLVYQVVGRTTAEMALLPAGGDLGDVAGPLGKPTHVENFGTVVCVGGGIGVAPSHPIAQAMKSAGNRVISILGARTADLIIMEREMRLASDDVICVTDDGSYGRKGLVTDALKDLLDDPSAPVNLVVAIGPPVMMKAVSELTRPYGVKTFVSLNTVMIDGTGMCGGCRVTVGGKTKFVCVDGPEFDGHGVDFDGMMRRQRMYSADEKVSYQAFLKEHGCRLEERIRELKRG
ncbi:MAG TPA: sulfide/dihydroorotate dehydrogenase-like FAD/NAD-binding protein [Myxococcota bacterium]|nr:sulfide/dihydroorotate dehydrogenase-like FAD/NAD-binding protein [Myxococcota bacterium]HOH76350.1 sulfide/dihydroorotate dehydrogenase-like FAD/NAD-binding protein [Myxococcota bacterium]